MTFNSGRSAVHLALEVVGVEPGDEVTIPPQRSSRDLWF